MVSAVVVAALLPATAGSPIAVLVLSRRNTLSDGVHQPHSVAYDGIPMAGAVCAPVGRRSQQELVFGKIIPSLTT